jgi:uncharacterized protein (DUF2249 family)
MTSGSSNTSPISPDTKLGALLEQYPQLEDVLVEMTPAFAKLQNPILRKTVAKVATLRQVAQIGNVSLGTLITRLRDAAGIRGEPPKDLEEPDNLEGPPEWLDRSLVSKSLDARGMIEAGEHPLHRVLEELDDLEAGKIYEIVTPFVPAPLIDMVRGKGYLTWSHEEKADLVRSYFTRNQAQV